MLPPIDPSVRADGGVVDRRAWCSPGGPDVVARSLRRRRHELTDRPRLERDEWELALLRPRSARRIPVLAVCRGAQLLNVACGGTRPTRARRAEPIPLPPPERLHEQGSGKEESKGSVRFFAAAAGFAGQGSAVPGLWAWPQAWSARKPSVLGLGRPLPGDSRGGLASVS